MRGDIYVPGGQCVNWYDFSEEKCDNIYPDKRHTDSLTQLSHLEEFILKLCCTQMKYLLFGVFTAA